MFKFKGTDFVKDEKVTWFNVLKNGVSPLHGFCHHLPILRLNIPVFRAFAIGKTTLLTRLQIFETDAGFLIALKNGW